MDTMTTPTLDSAVCELRRALAYSEARAAKDPRDLYWTAQVDAYRHALDCLDARP